MILILNLILMILTLILTLILILILVHVMIPQALWSRFLILLLIILIMILIRILIREDEQKVGSWESPGKFYSVPGIRITLTTRQDRHCKGSHHHTGLYEHL